jgi:hypothetical protein
MQRVTKRHSLPTIHVLDNEASMEFKTMLQTPFQIVPPHSHRHNAAEVAIKTFKHHIIGIIAGTHKQFPLQLWCKGLAQAEITINLLRESHQDPEMSAYHAMFSPFNFDATLIAPLCIKALIHENHINGNHGPFTPLKDGTWAQLFSIIVVAPYLYPKHRQNKL